MPYKGLDFKDCNTHVILLSISTYLQLDRKKQKLCDGCNLPIVPHKLFWKEKY